MASPLNARGSLRRRLAVCRGDNHPLAGMGIFDPHAATEAEALAEASRVGDKRPYLQWYTASQLERHREHFLKKPLEGIAACVQAGIVAPGWLASEFSRCMTFAAEKPARSWDEVFEPPIPKGRHVGKVHEIEAKRFKVLDAIQRMVFRQPPPPFGRQPAIDALFWDEVSDISGVGSKRAEQIYAEAVRDGHQTIQQMRESWERSWREAPT